jgi:hypothetical protein
MTAHLHAAVRAFNNRIFQDLLGAFGLQQLWLPPPSAGSATALLLE